ncbi:MAG: GFA family protein [Rhodospirillales bacterium]|jgi:hypothetical protein|nr:GFA family protein [Rhodospirillales bacterium]MBT4041060.1 GFA family protein [Rhodospirillales bacterium]MBT4628383.1 GFA family protein [Rhodospirillales bacterium]MBT5350966.1 GFA family protein [Rhodospirillales bacterium]MBT5522119.1 GFA family protein [Rhodospirillales bacterium]
MRIDGGCHCGHITYEAEINPDDVIICHCTDCQSISGAPYRTVVFTSSETFNLLSGELTVYIKTAQSGNKRTQNFCPKCGSHIYASNVGDGPMPYGVRVGTVHQRDQLVPKSQYFCGSAQNWVTDLSGIEKHD